MPTYTFVNNETSEETTTIMSIAEYEQYKQDHPHMKQKLFPAAIGDSVRLGFRRTDDNFNDVLKKAKESHKYSTIQTR